MAYGYHQLQQNESCGCFRTPGRYLVNHKELGMDYHFAVVSLLKCSVCGQPWLMYFYEIEAFTASGRWYLGAITAQQSSDMEAEDAKSALEGLRWYFYGGSYYGGQTGRSVGIIDLNP